ncbi:MAG TPA: peptidoglycan -binding protein [Candidatus Sulfotelmatobacter sp.]|nr:peptidoglycan -binding protein [Candidatus Sulfotelmatobacter sp.]
MPGSVRRSRGVVEFWPGFVDALSTLLIVIIFLVLVFVLAQFFLNQAISGRDEALQRLHTQIAQLADLLAMEKSSNAELRLNVGQLSSELQASASARDEALARVAGIVSERDALAVKLKDVTAQLAEAKTTTEQATAEAQKARKDLEDANKSVDADKQKLTVQLAELEQLRRDIDALKTVRAQLEQQVAGYDKDLTAARDKTKELEAKLSTETERTALSQKEIAQRDIRLAELLAQSDVAKGQMAHEKQLSAASEQQVELLNQQIAALRQQLAAIADALQVSESKVKEQDVQIVDLGKRLNAALVGKVQELARYRSEFFGRLRQVLGNRPDVRIVGDRFVFQSEVLFRVGSAELGDDGKQQLTKLAATLRDLMTRIPKDIPWVLRVDGHTDKVPIHNAQFASNWELSTARAVSVVKFLIEQGVPPDRLAAAGFGEFQPLDTHDNEAALRRNRRIELKLTER